MDTLPLETKEMQSEAGRPAWSGFHASVCPPYDPALTVIVEPGAAAW